MNRKQIFYLIHWHFFCQLNHFTLLIPLSSSIWLIFQIFIPSRGIQNTHWISLLFCNVSVKHPRSFHIIFSINDHDNFPVGIFSRRNTVYNSTNRTLLELPTSGRDNCQSWYRELADFRYRNVRHHRRPIASRINRQQHESRKRDISRYIVTTNFLLGD